MRVLIIGGGGREHALYLKIKESPLVKNVLILPGNAGIANTDRILNTDVSDFPAILNIIKENNINLLVVGPEIPLVKGIKDFFNKEMPDLFVFGPDKNGALLEGSKIFADEFMKESKIPAPRAKSASSLEESLEVLDNFSLPVVLKADGLAAGKGVSIHDKKEAAEKKLREIFSDKIFGTAGEKVLFQEFLTGEEASLFALLNGKEAIILPTARDYKAAYDDGKGPNTGGMGSFSPGSTLSEKHISLACEKIVKPVLEKFAYTGILYIGLMVNIDKPEETKVLEFNCRFGDPETQSILPMIEGDIIPYILWSCGDNDIIVPKIKEENYYKIPQKHGCTLNTVIAAEGYPFSYEKNIELNLPEKLPKGIHIIHAGTAEKENKIVSSGGRILNIVAYGKNLPEAKNLVYKFIETLEKTNDFKRLFYRHDIGS
ncbi:MAG: phosphoribosylamine--glycine ligase [Spirochaetia bacterium]|nr:phosphoribosylamine--glycine ligase [Spirochaetia bacterium]